MNASAAPISGGASSADVIVSDISEGLTIGRYAPGQRLSEPELMQRYGVSRGPVREALRRLQAEGVVTLGRHRGASIRLFSRGEMIEILELIEVLAGLAARLLAGRVQEQRTRDRFDILFAELLRFEGVAGTAAAMQARDDFFTGLIQLSGSEELQRVFPRMQLRMMRLQVAEPALEAIRFDEYREIGSAIVSSDATAAEDATRRHFRSAVDLFRNATIRH